MKSLSILLLIILPSCASIKEAREAKFVGKVLANPASTERVGMIYNGMHPINQAPIYIRGKDSVILVTEKIPYRVDSLIREQCPDLNIDSLIRLYGRTVYVNRVDTVNHKDTTSMYLLNQQRIGNALLQGRLLQSEKQAGDQKKGKNKLIYWIIGLAILSVGLLVLWIKKW